MSIETSAFLFKLLSHINGSLTVKRPFSVSYACMKRDLHCWSSWERILVSGHDWSSQTFSVCLFVCWLCIHCVIIKHFAGESNWLKNCNMILWSYDPSKFCIDQIRFVIIQFQMTIWQCTIKCICWQQNVDLSWLVE